MLNEFDNGNNSVIWIIYDIKEYEYRLLKITRFYKIEYL
jgi:hypothetical protein